MFIFRRPMHVLTSVCFLLNFNIEVKILLLYINLVFQYILMVNMIIEENL